MYDYKNDVIMEVLLIFHNNIDMVAINFCYMIEIYPWCWNTINNSEAVLYGKHFWFERHSKNQNKEFHILFSKHYNRFYHQMHAS